MLFFDCLYCAANPLFDDTAVAELMAAGGFSDALGGYKGNVAQTVQTCAHNEVPSAATLRGDIKMYPVARRHSAPSTTAPAKSIAPDDDDDQVVFLELSEAPAIRDSLFT